MSGRGRSAKNRGKKSGDKGAPSSQHSAGKGQSGKGAEKSPTAAVEQAISGQEAPIVEQSRSSPAQDSFEMSPEEEDIMLRALLAYEEAVEKASGR